MRPRTPSAPERGSARAEDLDVGVAEAVDRLRLVADREEVVALERLEHVELQPVRVLELVDHDQLEARRPARAQRGVGGEQVAHAQLEVLEVDAGARVLRGGVGAAEARRAARRAARARAARGGRRRRRGTPPTPRGRRRSRRARAPWRRSAAARRRARPAAAARRRRAASALAGRRAPRARPSTRAPLAGARSAAPRGRGRGRAQRRRVGRRRRRRDAEPRMRRAAAAQLGVGAHDHRLELAPVGGGEVQRRRAVRGGPCVERRLERLGREPARGAPRRAP